jgi:hypothetical protein
MAQNLQDASVVYTKYYTCMHVVSYALLAIFFIGKSQPAEKG